jgi:hypothetical protein
MLFWGIERAGRSGLGKGGEKEALRLISVVI